MSTLSNTDLTVADANITTLKDGSGNNPSTPAEIISGRAKYWCIFQGTGTAAILDSFNSAGFSDSGVGIYAITIATDFGSANYVALGTVSNSSRANCSIGEGGAGTFTVNTRETDSGTFTDYGRVSLAAFGDQ
jgi:hypothetical protein